MIWIILYIAVASMVTFALIVGAHSFTDWKISVDFPWPVISGIFWPVAAPIAGAYIAALWYLNNRH